MTDDPILDNDTLEEAAHLLALAREKGWTLATAESCTGGLIAACLTEIAGSSEVVDRALVTYSNRAKQDLLGVPAALIDREGAVSAAVALMMARGALWRSQADMAVAVTGVAGPGGGTAAKPVGLVHLAAVARDGRERSVEMQFDGDRRAVRRATVRRAFALLREIMTGAA